MLALIRNDEVLSQVSEGGRFEFDGNATMPAYDGWSNGDYRLETIQEAAEVPEGKQIASSSVEMVEGHPKRINVLEDIPVVIPDRVSRRQFKMQLEISGLAALVDGWVAGQSTLVQIAFKESGEFVRTEPMMQSGFGALGFTTGEIDAFFTAAAAL